MNFGMIILNLKYQNNAKLCYMETDNFITYIKTEGGHEDIADDVEKDLIYQITKSIDQCLQERIKK